MAMIDKVRREKTIFFLFLNPEKKEGNCFLVFFGDSFIAFAEHFEVVDVREGKKN